ncbi:MAG: LytR family transcriptional regulator [Ruminiclostridium sp.]|nr:LytR family transcriptional regulator [Ruminiclostridium sp.]
MNLRRFYFITTIIVSSFLFIAGIAVIRYINNSGQDGSLSANSNNPINDIFKPFMRTKSPFNVLILGGDRVNKNSDTMMLLNFDVATYKINVMSIPRDTKVKIEKNYRKINYAYPHGGIDLAVQTVSELLDVNIKYYVFVDTSAFKKIIDLLGGVKINVPADMDYDDPTQNLHIHLKKGLQTLNGEKSEQFIRFRDPNRWTKEIRKFYDGSDLKRIEAQQYFITELIRQKFTLQYITRMNSIINSIFENIETNFSLNEIVKLSGLVSKINSDSISFISMPGTVYDGSPWYFLCDVEKTREITETYFKGSESYVAVENDAKKNYLKTDLNKDSNNNKTTSKSSTGTKSTTKNNPSNSDSSLNGEQTPAP